MRKIKEILGEYDYLFDSEDIEQFEKLYQERGEEAVFEAVEQEIKNRT